MRVIRLLFLGLIGLILVLLLGWVAVNAIDEPLKEEARTLRFPPQITPVPAEQNLYLALIGRDAPHGESPLDYGQAVIDQYEAKLPARLEDPAVSMAPVTRGDESLLTFRGKLDLASPGRANIWPGLENRKEELEKLIQDNQELFDRYRAQLALTGYQETATPSPYQPFLFPARELRSLFLAHVALRLKSNVVNEQKGALDDLEHDIKTWHMMFLGSSAVLPKMLALFYIHGDDLLLAEMIADKTIKIDPLMPQLDRITTPFELGDWKMGDSLPGEFRRYETVLEQAEQMPLRTWKTLDYLNRSDEVKVYDPPAAFWEPFARYFYKKNATENLRAADLLHGIAYANLAPPALLPARQAYLRWRLDQNNLNFGILDNPMGKLLLAEMVFGVDGYVLRAYDGAAIQRLTKLAYEIRRQHVPADQVAGFMQQHPEWSTHPVSGKAYIFSPDSESIAVTPVSDRASDWLFSAPVWTGG